LTKATKQSFAILGAGILGLTTALRLAQRGHQVTVYERESLAGGLAAGFNIPLTTQDGRLSDRAWLEKFYHHLFQSDTHIIKLIEEIGLQNKLEWHRPLTVTLRNGQFHQLDSAPSLLRFPAMPFTARLRTGAGLAFLRALPSPDMLEGRLAARWIQQVMGERSYETIWGPLLRGKFGDASEEIALPWFWARVHDRTPQLGYIRGGFQQFYEALAAHVQQLGGVIHYCTLVRKIEQTGKTFSLTTAPADEPEAIATHAATHVIATLPTQVTYQITPQLRDTPFAQRYAWGRAYGAQCLILSLDRPLTSYYWINITDPGFPFLVLVEHTNFMSSQDYDGNHLIYLGNYRPMTDPIFTMPKSEILHTFLPALSTINAQFSPKWVKGSWLFTAAFAQPIVTREYREHIPPFATPLKGLYLANMFQVYPHDRGQNFSVLLGEQLVAHLQKAGVC
jgi:protoporphyrinogen oxidase